MKTPIPQTVIDKDHELEARTTRSTEALAKHRWRHTLDPSGPKFGFRAYAHAVGRREATVRNHANGYALFVERATDARPGRALTIQDAVRLAGQSAEQQAFTEAIAEGSGEPVANVARGDNRRRRDIVDRAHQRAARRGTDAVDEARDIAASEAKATKAQQQRRTEERSRRSVRFIAVEGKLAGAQRYLRQALDEAAEVAFNDEEMALIRASIANVQTLLNLIDLRMAGTPDIDWDAELAKLGGAS